MIRVLFVCLGNICRSPMAEAVFCHLLKQANLADNIQADSAGTGEYHIGESPHHGTQRVLVEHGIDYVHAARVVTKADLEHFDYIVALDPSNLVALRSLAKGTSAKLSLLLDYVPGVGRRDVPDPDYTGRFDEVYQLVERGCRGLLDRIIVEHKL